jgi:hypothetical protein
MLLHPPRLLLTTTQQGTVHIFNLANNGGTDSAKAQKSRLSFMGGLGLLPSSLDDYVRRMSG